MKNLPLLLCAALGGEADAQPRAVARRTQPLVLRETADSIIRGHRANPGDLTMPTEFTVTPFLTFTPFR